MLGAKVSQRKKRFRGKRTKPASAAYNTGAAMQPFDQPGGFQESQQLLLADQFAIERTEMGSELHGDERTAT